MVTFIIIFLAFVTFLCIYLHKLCTKKPKNFPPGPPSLPIWGGYWFLLLANYNFTHKAIDVLAKQYKSNIVGLLAGDFPVILVTGYNLVKEALIRDEFIGRPDVYVTRYRSLGDLLGNFFIGITFTDGNHWKEQRRFSLRQLRDYGFGRRFASTEVLFEGDVKALIEYLNANPNPNDNDIHCKKGRVLIPDLFYGALSNAILHMLVGKRFEDKEMRELARSTLRFLRNVDATGRAISITPWIRHLAPEYFGSKPLHIENTRMRDFFLELVEERQKNFSDDHHGDFLDTFLSTIQQLQREGIDLGKKQLIWILADYLIPSPNVVGPALNMLWAHLCKYPDVQVKIQEEIDRVVGRSRLPNLDDRKNMPYTEAVLRESLRMDPVVPINIPRRCLEDTTLGGYSIPKVKRFFLVFLLQHALQDTLVLISLWSANYDSQVWDDPEQFRPERFLDDNGNLLKKYYTVSFGGGKRLCVGETFSRNNMFLMLSGLLQNFNFKAVGEVPNLENKKWGLICDIPAFWVDAISR
ncbi:hypothetical protein RI129_012905 [Pyrocoelia pectoralis]|uniref:Cytochrome P450 n=1 Tax=Pyrocoelia pectoralis TaxID=417401 RepID=A0AAN7UUV0_9COLE